MRLFTGEFKKMPLQRSCTCQGTHELEDGLTPCGEFAQHYLGTGVVSANACATMPEQHLNRRMPTAVRIWLCLPGSAPRHQNALLLCCQKAFCANFLICMCLLGAGRSLLDSACSPQQRSLQAPHKHASLPIVWLTLHLATPSRHLSAQVVRPSARQLAAADQMMDDGRAVDLLKMAMMSWLQALHPLPS